MRKFLLKRLYSFGILVLALLKAPKLMMSKKKVFPRLFPSPLPKQVYEEECVWIHAVSVGEVKAVSTLAAHLKLPLIVSTITETGLEEAKRSIPQAVCHLLLPLDFKGVMRPLLRGVKLKNLILSETDYWWHFLSEVKNLGAKIVLVNGKLSDRSFEMRRRFKGLNDEVFSLFDRFFLQSEQDKTRFLSLGVPLDRIEVTSNLKFSAKMTPTSADLRKKLHLQKGEVVVFGSTHLQEEPFLFQVIKEVLKEKSITVLVVPRHPERFIPFYESLKSLGASLLSEGGGGRLILIDQMGVLTKCYEVADLAVVCGSFAQGIGGHNILEPLFFKVATFFGPYMEGQKPLVEKVLKVSGALQVTGEELAQKILKMLEDREERESLGERGYRSLEEKGGIDPILHFLVASK